MQVLKRKDRFSNPYLSSVWTIWMILPWSKSTESLKSYCNHLHHHKKITRERYLTNFCVKAIVRIRVESILFFKFQMLEKTYIVVDTYMKQMITKYRS